MRSPSFSLRLAFAVIIGAVVAAAMTAVGRMPEVAGTPAIAELWQDPGEIAARDLRWGRGGEALHPSPEVEYEFKAIDAVGYSAGYQSLRKDELENRREVGLIVTNPAMARGMLKVFDSDWDESGKGKDDKAKDDKAKDATAESAA